MKPKNLSKKVWLVMTGFSCNNNCVMCSTRPKAKNYPDRPTEEIIKDLRKGRKEGYLRAEFTGGEPAIRPDILDLIKIAKGLGYKEVALSTNARMFSYNSFCQKAIKNGLTRVTFTLNAPNYRLGDAICRTPGAFEQTLQGVKNILEHPQITISANTVVFQLNYQYLCQIGEFINNLGIKTWNILDLIPDGYAKDFYQRLTVKVVDLSLKLGGLKNIIKNFQVVSFFDFPLCLFTPTLRESPFTNFITAQGRVEIEKQIGYQPKRFEVSSDNFYEDIHKQRIEICQKCKFFQSCGGIWKDYLNLYGTKEIEYLAIKHKCLSKSSLTNCSSKLWTRSL